MGALDSIWLRLDEPSNPMVITAVLWFDTPLRREDLLAVLRTRLVEAYPRFRQRVVRRRHFARPLWRDEPGFDLDAHLLSARLPPPGDRRALERFVSGVMCTPLEPSRPLWQMHLVEGFGSGCALVARIHHCIADGISLARLLLSLVDEERTGARRAETGQRGRRLREALRAVPRVALLGARAPVSAAAILFKRADPEGALRGPLGPDKRVAWSESFPLEKV
jgi:WS/DGAT/MGAT family acyltransferase